MKKLLLATYLISSFALNAVEKQELITRMELTCFNGKIDCRSKCSTTIEVGERIAPLKANSGLTCGYAGRVSKITWEWKKDKEAVLVFTRIFPVDSDKPSISKKEITYEGERVVVFEDEHQVITVGPRKSMAEQGVAPQSATRSESDSEGGKQPQPDSEGRSR